MAPAKALFFNRKVLIFSFLLHEKICCGYSLEVPCQGTSYECPQNMFFLRNKKTIVWVSHQTWSYGLSWYLSLFNAIKSIMVVLEMLNTVRELKSESLFHCDSPMAFTLAVPFPWLCGDQDDRLRICSRSTCFSFMLKTMSPECLVALFWILDYCYIDSEWNDP